MKGKFKIFLLTIWMVMSQGFLAYAGFEFESQDKTLMANRFLAGILAFLQKCSFVMFVFALGMFLYSVSNEDGAKKTDALKLFGVGLLLFGLKIVAEVAGLI